MPKIFLTFDDGPGEKTIEIAEYLHSQGAKATFFMVGKNIEKNPAAVKRVAELGHEIGVHGYSHRLLRGMTAIEQATEIEKTAALIQKITGKKPRVFRAPGGELSPGAIIILARHGLWHVDWSQNTRDHEAAKQGTPIKTGKIIQGAMFSDVILIHDGATPATKEFSQTRAQNALDAIKIIVPMLKKKGYSFAPVTSAARPMVNPKYAAKIAMKYAGASAWGTRKAARNVARKITKAVLRK